MRFNRHSYIYIFVLLILYSNACKISKSISKSNVAKISKRASIPNILFVLVDDFGWNDIGYHRLHPNVEVLTPVMDKLATEEGVILNRHYVHMTCTPSRSAFQTGRLPVHVVTKLVSPCDINGAIPRNMTGIASKLKEAA